MSVAKTGRVNAGLPVTGRIERFVSIFSALFNLFVPSHHDRSAFAIHLHRLRAMAHWKSNRNPRLKSQPKDCHVYAKLM